MIAPGAAPSRKIGDIAVTALSDGVLAAPLDVVLDMDKGEAERLAGTKPGEPKPIAVNAFLLELGGKWALVDTGAGNTMGPTLGKLSDNLRALGVGAGGDRDHLSHPSPSRPFQWPRG